MSAVLKSACQKAEAVVAALPERIQQVFDFAQEKTGVQRAYFMLGLGAFSALYLIFGYFAELLCNIVGLVYPAYASTRAIESADRNDDTRWLTYWVVYACFSILDFFADGILRFFPFYWLVKVVFLVYCFLPARFNGSARIYNSLIRPYFLKSSGQIDSAYAKMAAKASSAFDSALKDSFAGKQQ
nr:receptor expression-enhancing protein 5-like [Dermacentor andersoni]